ncbi:MAG: GTPase HflX, partial [Bacteroidota bacterium]|nr:GTPase HflX [Bacteroidota bacterium]
MGDYWDHRPQRETAVLVGVITQNQTEEMATDYLEELAFLADTAGAEQRAVFTQRLEVPNPKTFIGSGKLQEVKVYVKAEEIDMV